MQTILVEDDYVSSAALFTARKYALAGHFRRHTGESFVDQPKALAAELSKLPHNREMLAVAWLLRSHRDRYTDIDEIGLFFGKKVARTVDQIARLNLPDQLSPDTLSAIQTREICKANAAEQTIALADLFILGMAAEASEEADETLLAHWLHNHLPLFNRANRSLVQRTMGWLASLDVSALSNPVARA